MPRSFGWPAALSREPWKQPGLPVAFSHSKKRSMPSKMQWDRMETHSWMPLSVLFPVRPLCVAFIPIKPFVTGFSRWNKWLSVQPWSERTEDHRYSICWVICKVCSYWLHLRLSCLMLRPQTDLESLNTFDIMWLARGCVERGDFEQAVKYMTLLKGEPKKVSSDWMSEARLLLETKQVCNALMSHAAAFGLEALPSKG